MGIIQKVLIILIKLIIIVGTIIGLFLLSLISIIIYLIFKFLSLISKNKSTYFKETFKANNTTVYTESNKSQPSNSKIKVSSNNTTNNFSSVKTINRKLKVKDGEIL